MTPRLRVDVPAVGGGVLVVLVTAGLPATWRAGLGLAVAGLLALGGRWRAPAATTGGLVLLVGAAALVTAPLAAAAVAAAAGTLAVVAADADADPPRAVDLRTRLVAVVPLVGVVVAAAPVALLAVGAPAAAAVWAPVGGGVLVAVLLGAAAWGPTPRGRG